MVLFTDTDENLQRLIDELNEQCRVKELKINKSRMEVMGMTKRRKMLAMKINIEGVAIKPSEKFQCFGTLVREDR